MDPGLNVTDSPTVDFMGRKRRILIALLAYSAFLGVLIILSPENSPVVSFVLGLPTLILAVAWCLTDAKARDFRIGYVIRLGLIMFFIVAFPIYVFRTRGLRGFMTLGLTVLFVMAMIVCGSITGILTTIVGRMAGFIEYFPVR